MNDLGREEGKKTRGRGGKRGKEAKEIVERGGGKEEGKQREPGEGGRGWRRKEEVGEGEEATYRRVSSMKHPY